MSGLSWHLRFYCRSSLRCRSQWPRGLKHRSAAARLLRLWVRLPPGAWMFVVSVVCCQVEVSATGWSLVQRSPTVMPRYLWSRNLVNGPLGGCPPPAPQKTNKQHEVSLTLGSYSLCNNLKLFYLFLDRRQFWALCFETTVRWRSRSSARETTCHTFTKVAN